MERKINGNGGEEYSDTEHSDSDSSSDEDDPVDGECPVGDSSDEEVEERSGRHQRSRRRHDYQNVSQLEWDNSTM